MVSPKHISTVGKEVLAFHLAAAHHLSGAAAAANSHIVSLASLTFYFIMTSPTRQTYSTTGLL